MQPVRRRKKRPNYGVRTVEVCRSENGFGFTISGQQPCILSCIVANSPAEKAGLRPGDYLIAVCGQNVSKVPHDDVVQLIGSCYGVLKLQIAENYYSDSSEEDFITTVRQKPKYKYKNVQTHPPGLSKLSRNDVRISDNFRSCNAINSTTNVNASQVNKYCEIPPYLNSEPEWVLQSVVGYLGTIEMPRKLTPVSRLQIIRGCIKRLRSEKRNYIAVLMTVFPCSLRLKNENGTTIAVYPGGRVTYCSANSEQDKKYFGIVTTSLEEDPSNSCHVFVMLPSIHEQHVKETIKFKLNCKKDENSGFCQQFLPSCDSIIAAVEKYYQDDKIIVNSDVLANSPLPSNDSATTSNSDSGIGFRDDSGHQSDRILVVDIQNQRLHIQAAGNSNLQYIDCTDHASIREDDKTTSDCFPALSNRDLPFPEEWCYDQKEHDLNENNVKTIPRVSSEVTNNGDVKKKSNSEITLLNKLTGNRCYNHLNDKCCVSHSLEDLKSQQEIDDDIEVSENITRKHSLQDISVFSGFDNQETSNRNKIEDNSRSVESPRESKVADWALSLERLLHDSIGIQVFAEFLRKEFSVENIYFWAACEKYQLLTDTDARKSLAYNICEKYLSNNATDPVNVDSSCQQLTQQQLNSANLTLFHHAQKQIFNLMKFDCYPRFLKSNLYKNCLMNELTEDTLTAMNIKFDPELIIIVPVSRKNNQDDADKQCRSSRRRRSLMPWTRSRCKSRDRSSNDNISSSSGSRGSLSSWDLALPNSLCRVILPDNSTAVLNVQMDQSVKNIINKLLEKRSYNYTAFHIISTSNDKAINLEDDSTVLSGKEVKIEWRIEFILDLPNRKSLVIKSKPTHSLAAVVSPILLKHGYNLQMVTFCLISENEVIEPTALVSSVDKQRVQVLTRSTPVPNMQGLNSADCEVNTNCGNLDEITNKVFEELLQGKAENFRTNKITENATSVHSEEWGSEHSSGILGRFLRRDSFFQDKYRKMKKCADTTNIMDKKHINKLPPVTTKWKVISKLDAHLEKEGLYEDLKRAQRGRLDDQRGTEINIELPDFLKDKENVPCNRKKLRKIRKDCNNEELNKNTNEFSANNNNNNNSNGNNAIFKNSYCRNNTIIEISNNNRMTEIDDLTDKCVNYTDKVHQQISNNFLKETGKNGNDINYNICNNNNNGTCSSNNNNNNNNNDIANNIHVSKLLNSEPPPLPPKPKNISCSWRGTNGINDTFCHKNIYLDQPNSSFV